MRRLTLILRCSTGGCSVKKSATDLAPLMRTGLEAIYACTVAAPLLFINNASMLQSHDELEGTWDVKLVYVMMATAVRAVLLRELNITTPFMPGLRFGEDSADELMSRFTEIIQRDHQQSATIIATSNRRLKDCKYRCIVQFAVVVLIRLRKAAVDGLLDDLAAQMYDCVGVVGELMDGKTIVQILRRHE